MKSVLWPKSRGLTRYERAERRAPVIGFLAMLIACIAVPIIAVLAISWLLAGMPRL